jgi:beta-lactam-binding protein with PASTA domain
MANTSKKKNKSTRKRDPKLAKIIEEIQREEEDKDLEIIDDKKEEKIEVLEDTTKKKETKKDIKEDNVKEKKETKEEKVVKEKKEVKEPKKEEKKEETKNEEKQEVKEIVPKKNSFIAFLSTLTIISFIVYLVFKYLDNHTFYKDLNTTITLVVLFLINILFIIIGNRNNNKKNNKFIILVLILTMGLNIYNILVLKDVVSIFENDTTLPNFYDKPITEVYEWNKKYNINIGETYEYSDVIESYNVISQDVPAKTDLKDVKTLNLIISNGPNYELETVVPSFIGWEYDTVIDYLEKHFLNNVSIEFMKSSNTPNTVIAQLGSGTRKRNELIKLTFAIDEYKETEIIDLYNYPLIRAIGWLEQHGFKYEISYENNDEISKDYVISNSNVGESINPITNDVIIKLVVSKGKIIKAPDFTVLSQDEINEWVLENDMKVDYQEKYDEEKPAGDIIDASYEKDDIIEIGSKIVITISKGKLEMPKINDINDFKIWASENNIKYQINNEFSDSKENGEIIKSSHSPGDAIKEDDTIIITVSKGKSVTVPNFIGMTKSNAQSKCNSLGLSCSFKYGGYTDKAKDIVTNQSQKSGIKISSGANLVITLSNGVQPKVTVPNFSGKTKSEIEKQCKNIGITCKFTYQSNYSSTKADTCVSQSKTGTVNKGSTVTITLSKGPAKTYNITIDANLLAYGDPNATKANLQKRLTSSKYPGVTFKYQFQSVSTGNGNGIGYLAKNSGLHVGNNTVTQGKTYTIIINSK